MSLEQLGDAAPAAWIAQSTTGYWQLIEFGPDCFEASARLRYVPDPTRPGEREGDVPRDPELPSDLRRCVAAIEVLCGWTGTPEELFCCWWTGSALPPGGREEPTVGTLHRDYALFRGGLPDLRALAVDEALPPPAFTWPADHRWVVASDVDPHFAGIGAERAAIEALVRDRRLDVVPARPRERQPRFA
ncbi:hypothetical protein [Blastococcus sp. SYSU D00695]